MSLTRSYGPLGSEMGDLQHLSGRGPENGEGPAARWTCEVTDGWTGPTDPGIGTKKEVVASFQNGILLEREAEQGNRGH